MKHFVLFFLLVLFPDITAKAQECKAKEIVGLALKAHNSGKLIERFEVYVEHKKLTGASFSLQQPYLYADFVNRVKTGPITAGQEDKK